MLNTNMEVLANKYFSSRYKHFGVALNYKFRIRRETFNCEA